MLANSWVIERAFKTLWTEDDTHLDGEFLPVLQPHSLLRKLKV
jgi:hypothetical protein